MDVEEETKITQLNRMTEVIDRNARRWQTETETVERKTHKRTPIYYVTLPSFYTRTHAHSL